MSRKKKTAFVTVGDANYTWGALVLRDSLRANGNEQDFIAVIPGEEGVYSHIDNALMDFFDLNPVRKKTIRNPYEFVQDYHYVKNYTPGHFQESCCFNKIYCWSFTEYDTIIYMDTDILNQHSMKDLFDIELGKRTAGFCNDTVGGGNNAVSAEMPLKRRLVNSGIILLKPDKDDYKWLRSKLGEYPSYDCADQGFFKSAFCTSEDGNYIIFPSKVQGGVVPLRYGIKTGFKPIFEGPPHSKHKLRRISNIPEIEYLGRDKVDYDFPPEKCWNIHYLMANRKPWCRYKNFSTSVVWENLYHSGFEGVKRSLGGVAYIKWQQRFFAMIPKALKIKWGEEIMRDPFISRYWEPPENVMRAKDTYAYVASLSSSISLWGLAPKRPKVLHIGGDYCISALSLLTPQCDKTEIYSVSQCPTFKRFEKLRNNNKWKGTAYDPVPDFNSLHNVLSNKYDSKYTFDMIYLKADGWMPRDLDQYLISCRPYVNKETLFIIDTLAKSDRLTHAGLDIGEYLQLGLPLQSFTVCTSEYRLKMASDHIHYMYPREGYFSKTVLDTAKMLILETGVTPSERVKRSNLRNIPGIIG